MIDMILNLGQTNGKGDLFLLGKSEREQAIREKKQELRILEKMWSRGGPGVAVEADTLITCFHRHKKFKR